jgi:hypothetical protein
MSLAQEVVVRLEEEYGYRNWVWIPEMSAEELKEWWQAIPTVAPYFYDGPKAFPGQIYQIYYEPDYMREAEHLEATLKKGEFFFVKQDKEGLTATSHSMQLPEDHWYAHIHMDCDSYLMTPDKETIHHAGYVPEDEYYNNDYKPSPEVEDAWAQAMIDQVGRIVKEEADGDNTYHRNSEEPN